MNPVHSTPPAALARAPRGFTIIELMVVVAISAVLVTAAMPGLQNLIAGRAVAAQTEELVEAFHYARAEAMKRGGPVTICRTSAATPSVCSTNNSGTWQYWMVFTEIPSTLNGTLDAGEIELRVQSSPPGKATFESVTPKYYSFQATGVVFANDNVNDIPAQLKVFPNLPTTSPAYQRYERQICLNRQGRASVIDANGTCTT